MLKKIPQKTYWTIAFITIIFGISVYYRFIKPIMRPEIIYFCRDFKTQQEAQKLFLTNPEKYKKLDRNHDGKACNGLPL